jgi:hypothetical protein
LRLGIPVRYHLRHLVLLISIRDVVETIECEAAFGAPNMDPQREAVPEADIPRVRQIILADLRRAERTLAEIEQTAPDSEGALHLVAIRAAIAQIETFVQPLAER